MSEKEESIVYLIETIFNAHSVNIKSWARKYENQVLNKKGLCVDTLAAAVIISEKFGLEQFIIKKKSIKLPDLQLVIDKLKDRYEGKQLTIFLDNLRANHWKLLQEQVLENGWRLMFNSPYSSKYNCIEMVYSRVKKNYTQTLCQHNFRVNNKTKYFFVEKSITQIQSDCKNSERRCLDLMHSLLLKTQIID